MVRNRILERETMILNIQLHDYMTCMLIDLGLSLHQSC